MTKPKYLYHASPNANLTILEPRAESTRHADEGPVVFAGADPAGVSKFLVPCNDSWSMLGAFNSVHFAVYNNKKRFEELDKGGAIYTLPSDTFFLETKFGGGKDEWTSKVPVKPISKKVYTSGLEAMLDFGVQVYFVDDAIFKSIVGSSDHGWSVIHQLVSENMNRNINVKEFE